MLRRDWITLVLAYLVVCWLLWGEDAPPDALPRVSPPQPIGWVGLPPMPSLIPPPDSGTVPVINGVPKGFFWDVDHWEPNFNKGLSPAADG